MHSTHIICTDCRIRLKQSMNLSTFYGYFIEVNTKYIQIINLNLIIIKLEIDNILIYHVNNIFTLSLLASIIY